MSAELFPMLGHRIVDLQLLFSVDSQFFIPHQASQNLGDELVEPVSLLISL